MLRKCITETLALNLKTQKHLDGGLALKIAEMKNEHEQKKEGFWRRLWLRVGSSREIVEPWLALVPNEYGLVILKTGLAVVFKVCFTLDPVKSNWSGVDTNSDSSWRRNRRRTRNGFIKPSTDYRRHYADCTPVEGRLKVI